MVEVVIGSCLGHSNHEVVEFKSLGTDGKLPAKHKP